jgi:hypothetical protein
MAVGTRNGWHVSELCWEVRIAGKTMAETIDCTHGRSSNVPTET